MQGIKGKWSVAKVENDRNQALVLQNSGTPSIGAERGPFTQEDVWYKKTLVFIAGPEEKTRCTTSRCKRITVSIASLQAATY